MGDVIADEKHWQYLGFNASTSTRHLRLWRTDSEHLVAVVSETPDDEGTSITNATEAIHAQLRAEYPEMTIQVIEHQIDEPVFGGREHYDAVTMRNGRPTWQPIKKADVEAKIGTQLADATTPQSTGRPRGGRRPAPKATVSPTSGAGTSRSAEPLLINGWGSGVVGGEVNFHTDSAIGRALQQIGDDKHLQVDGGALGNVLGRLATDLVHGRTPAQETVEAVARLRDSLPAGSSARTALDRAVNQMDAPLTPAPTLPDSAPASVRQLVQDLHAIPLIRQRPELMRPLLDVIDDLGAGRPSPSWDWDLSHALREMSGRVHESQEGLFDIYRAADRVKEARKAEQGRQ